MIIDIEPDIEPGSESAPGAAAIRDDPARVAFEFAAIMMASGFGDRVIAATLDPRADSRREPRERRVAGCPVPSVVVDSSNGARVRSPPRP